MTAGEAPRLDEWVETVAPGAVRAVLTDDVVGAVSALAVCAGRRGVTAVHVAPSPPSIEEAIAQAIRALAQAAQELWPDWYGEAGSPEGPSRERVAARHPRVLARWLTAAGERARRGLAPLVHDLPLEVQAGQLALALDPSALVVALGLQSANPGDAKLASFARGAEWLASKTAARVVAVVPWQLEGALWVDPIAYGALRLMGREPSAAAPAHVFPVMGRPHPGSEAEQVLARALARDEELCPLFEFNQRLSTGRRAHPTVDLVWREGRLVVELDGWETHGNRWAFASDRHRDYELALSGYVVLRLTNDEVLRDPALTIDKIRDLVRARRTLGKEAR